MNQNPAYFTLQILGVRKEKSIFKFVSKYNLDNKFAYFHTYFKNKDWYPLLYGIYPSYKEASREIKRLPKEIRMYSPWVRQISSVQRAIKNRNADNLIENERYFVID